MPASSSSGRRSNARTVSTFKDQTDLRCAEVGQAPAQRTDVSGVLDEGHLDDVGALHDERQARLVVLGQAGDGQVSLGGS